MYSIFGEIFKSRIRIEFRRNVTSPDRRKMNDSKRSVSVKINRHEIIRQITTVINAWMKSIKIKSSEGD